METQQTKITLETHRRNLLNNPNRYIYYKETAINNFAETAYTYYGRFRKNKNTLIQLLRKLGELVFQCQEGKPLYEYQDEHDTLPRAWNSPMKGGFELDYIKWEIGHLISSHQGGLNNPENLSFQSARCNQHIQSGLNYYETTEYKKEPEVKNRVDALLVLHKSKEWTDIIDEIKSIVEKSNS